MKKDKEITTRTYNNLLERIAEILNQARTKVVREINNAQVLAYWEIGREIVEFEQKGKVRAEYCEELLKRLSADMTAKFGRGFSRSNLQNMRIFLLAYRKCQTLSGKSDEAKKFQTPSGKSETLSRKSAIGQTPSDQFEPMLSWSHYCKLLKVEEQDKNYGGKQ
ncbi:MAG: DUF1016 N-terminal domain-containing protein [Candidatus Hodarchaeales archaeon]